MDILIHASRQRIKYIGFLQKCLPKSKVIMDFGLGNIMAYMYSLHKLSAEGNTWHLEDDVLPDRRIEQWMDELEDREGIICGFGTTEKYGEVSPEDMWYSFPCIRIPNDYARDFLQWLKHSGDEDVERRMEIGKGIDFLFRKYVLQHPIPIYHHNPCMVEHIDDYIGGSLLNKRDKPIKAICFEDEERINELKRWLEVLNESDLCRHNVSLFQ